MERMTWAGPSDSRLEMLPFVTASDQALGSLIVPPPPGVSTKCYKREQNAAYRDSPWTMAARSTQAARQYSAASMIVRTRTVWRGSLGSSLPQVSVGS